MKLYRYLFFVLLFAAGILTSSSELVNRWQNCIPDSYPNIQLKLNERNRGQAVALAAELGEKYGLGVFIHDDLADNSSRVYSTYYANAKARAVLTGDWRLRPCTVRDSAAARYEYVFDIRELDEAAELMYYHNLSLIGEREAVDAFAAEFADYAGTCFEEGEASALREARLDTKRLELGFGLYVWIAAIAVLAVMTAFETAVFRKEAVVMLTNGSSIGSTVLKLMCTDTAVYSLLLTVLSLIMTGAGFPSRAVLYALLALAVLLCVSLLIYLSLFVSDIRAALGDAKRGARTVAFNYLIKALTVTGCLVLCLNTADTVRQNRSGSDAEALINEYFGGYCYSDAAIASLILNQDDGDSANIKETVYRIYSEHYYDLKPMKLSHSTDITGQYHYVTANRYAVEYLRSQIPEMSEYDGTTRFCVLIKRGTDTSVFDVDGYRKITEQKYSTAKYGRAEVQVIYYDGGLELMCIGADTNTGIDYASDPVITVEDLDPEFLADSGTNRDYTALLLDDTAVDMLCSQYNMRREDLKAVPVSERYASHWEVIKAAILSQMMLALAAAATVLLIGASTAKYTFIARAKELCIRKVLGDGIARRYLSTFIINTAVYTLSCAAAYYLAFRFVIAWDLTLALASAAVLYAADTFITALYIIRQEQQSAQKILKGGAL